MACWTTLSRSSPARQGWFSLKQWMCPSSDPSTATVSAQLLNESIIILLSKPSHAARIHLTISLRGGARMFPAAVKEWASPAIHSSYFSVTFALNGIFQTTSGAWMYFVQLPGMIKGSILDVRSSCLTVSITWHLNESHAKIRRVNGAVIILEGGALIRVGALINKNTFEGGRFFGRGRLLKGGR